MADDAIAAMFARGSQFVDGAFKAVKLVGIPVQFDLKTFVIVISTDFTRFHLLSSPRSILLVLAKNASLKISL